jgi:hypothetical protein
MENTNVGLDTIQDVAADLEECLVLEDPTPNERDIFSRDKDMLELEKVVKDMLDIETMLTIQRSALETLERQMLRDEMPAANVVSWYEARVADQVAEYENKDDVDKYNVAKYKEFRKRIWDIRHEEDGKGAEDEDDDMQVVSHVFVALLRRSTTNVQSPKSL